MRSDPMTRRAALGVLSAAMMPRVRGNGLLHATRVDHVALDVGDLDHALAYYRRLFGNEVLKDTKSPRRYLRLGPCYLAIAPVAAGQSPHINHFAIGIEDFNAASLKVGLEGVGIKVRESNVGLMMADPDGNIIQIWADQSWKLLSNAAPERFPRQDSLFHAIGMHHMAVQSGDTGRSVEFYAKLLGPPVYDRPDHRQPLFLAGDTRLRIYDPAANKSPKIDHFCALVENFDASASLKVLKAMGAKAELSRNGTLNEFFDPEGIRMQVSFPGQLPGSAPKK